MMPVSYMPLNKQTIVLTGATSGIGRATAMEFARYGAKLVLAARQKDILDEMVDLCDRLGGKAIAVVTDVTDAEAMKQLGNDACIFGGGIDVWVNVAGIGAMGEFTTMPIDLQDQIVRTNLLGYMHGAHAALNCFKKQRRGVLINVNSIGGWVPFPYSAAYTASKFGVRGFSEALRAELHNCPNIHICEVAPGFVDTPGPSHAGNYTGKVLKPAPPVVPTYKVAHTIVDLSQKPRDVVFLGSAAYLARLGQMVTPNKVLRWGLAKFMEIYFKNAEPAPVTNGSIFEPTGAHNQISGGYSSRVSPKKVTRAIGVAGAVGLLASAFLMLKKK